MFVNFVNRLRDTGYSKEQRRGHSGRPAKPWMLKVAEPTMSTRAIAAPFEISHGKMWKMLRQ